MALLYEVGRNMIFANGQYRWVGYTHAELKQLCGGNYKLPNGVTIRSVIRESFSIASELAHTLKLSYKQVGNLDKKRIMDSSSAKVLFTLGQVLIFSYGTSKFNQTITDIFIDKSGEQIYELENCAQYTLQELIKELNTNQKHGYQQ